VQKYTWEKMCLSAAETLMPKNMHLRPEEVHLAAAEMLVTVGMYLRPQKVPLEPSEKCT
jgi:hypothetical protein